MKNALIIFALLGCLLIFGQCTNPFAPAEAENNATRSILLTEQLTPDEVLQNFLYAYTFKDSLVYSELFDSTFTFISQNFNVSPPEPINWGRDQELRTVGRMFRFFNTLDLTWGSRPLPEPIPGTTEYERRITFTLTLDGGMTIPTLIGVVTFRFIKRGDKWYIARWVDDIPGA